MITKPNTDELRSHRLKSEQKAMVKTMEARRKIEKIEEKKAIPLTLEQELDRLMKEY